MKRNSVAFQRVAITAMMVLLVACLPARAPAATPTAAPAATASAPSPTATGVPGTPAVSGQYEITAEDSGRTFVYTLTTRFAILLDQNLYPKENLRVEPKGVIGSVSNIPSVAPPLYAVRFEAIAPGQCIIQNGSFTVTIVVIE